MCLIVRGRVSNLLKLDLDHAENSNPDGYGIHTPDRVILSFDAKLKYASEVLAELPGDTLATIHFRLATHGKVNKPNAHPFTIGEGVFLMHNGVLRGIEYDCPKGKHSDTALLAKSLVPMDHKSRCKTLHTLAVANRFCLLNGDQWKKFGTWQFDASTKTWHSNGMLLGNGSSRCYDPRKWNTKDYFSDSDSKSFSDKFSFSRKALDDYFDDRTFRSY
jgi:predicted glutamine amidotransferase